jgi:hypothetical protein
LVPEPPAPPPPPGGDGERAGMALIRPLALRDFALLWTGMTVSLLGDGVYFVAIAWQVLQMSNSPTSLAAVGFAWTLPQVVFLLFGGVVSDRFERRKVMIGSDLVRALTIGAVGLLAIQGSLKLWHLFVLVAIYGAGDAFFVPAFSAIVPEIVAKRLLLEANALDQFVRPLTLRLLGPALGGLLVATAGAGNAFLVDSATFAFSALCILLITARPAPPKTGARQSVLTEIGQGFAFVRSQTWLWGTLLAIGIGLLCFFGPYNVLVPFIVKRQLAGDAGSYGLVLASGGVGSLLSALLIAQRGQPRRHITFMYMSWAVATFLIAYFAAVTKLWQAMVVSLFMSALLTSGQVVWMTMVQRMVPNELLGRVSSFDWLTSTSLIPLSFALTGPIAGAIGIQQTLAAAGVLGGAIVIAFLFIPGLRDLEREEEPAPV